MPVACALCTTHCPIDKRLAFKFIDDTRGWSHLLCALWDKEVVINDISSMSSITFVESVKSPRKSRKSPATCQLCDVPTGIVIQCPGNHREGKCSIFFHPSCALINKYFMHLGSDNTNLHSEIYCPTHTPVELFCVSTNSICIYMYIIYMINDLFVGLSPALC